MRYLLLVLCWLLMSPSVWAGSSRDFDGVDDIINAGSAASLDNLGSQSQGGWINPAGWGEGSFGRIETKNDQKGCFLDNDGTAPSTTLRAAYITTGVVEARSASAGFISLNAWQFVTCVWDGTIGTGSTGVTLFKDASATGSYGQASDATGTEVDDSAGNHTIGNNAATTRTFDGNHAYVFQYNNTITTTEMSQIMYLPGTVPLNLVGLWPMWGDSPEVDLSGNGNTGTVTGAAASVEGPPVMFGGGLPL